MAFKDWFPPIAQGAGGIIGSIISNIGQKKMQRRAFQHNMDMASYAYQNDLDMWNRQSSWNQQMWNLQNQYNLPANQMARLRAAGLNPNLVATSGASGGSAGNIASAQSPHYQQVRADYSFPPIDVPNVLGFYNSFQLANAQKDQLQANTDLTQSKAVTESINQGLVAARRAGVRAENELKFRLADYSSDIATLMLEQRRVQLRNALKDEQIKGHIVGRTASEAGLKAIEYKLYKNLGMKGMREIAPFLQLLLDAYRRR